MSTTVSADCGKPIVHELVPILSRRWQLNWRHLVVCGCFGALFMVLGHLPRTTSRVWLDLSQGRAILEAGGVPAADATLPLSDGMPVVFNAWLSDLIAASTAHWGGEAGAVSLFALIVWLYLVVLAGLFYAQAPRWPIVLFTAGAVILLDAPLRSGAGPQVWGALCFGVLLATLTRLRAPGFGSARGATDGSRERARGWRPYVAIGLLFALWANLHLSFLAGLVVLAAVAAGRLYVVAVKTRSIKRVASDRILRRWILLTEVAAVAALINPYGMGLYFEAVRLLTHEHLLQSTWWETLSLRSWPGVLLLATVAVLAFALRRSRRRIHPCHVILLLLSAGAVLISGYGLRWFAPIVAFVLARHLYDAVPQISSRAAGKLSAQVTEKLRKAIIAACLAADLEPPAFLRKWRKGPLAFTFTLLCGVVLWTGFAYSPIGHGLLGGGDRVELKLVGHKLPNAAGDLLREQRDRGLVWAPVAWSDWLAWHAGPGTELAINSDSHRLPKSVLEDHKFVGKGAEGWEKALDNYRVKTLLVDKAWQAALAEAAQKSPAWQIVFEDEMALIAQRVPGVKPSA